MAFTRDSIVEKLRGAGVEFSVVEHGGCQAEDVAQTLFLQDKKKRLILLAIVAPTKADLAVLSARLGTGKGGLKAAPAELESEVLKVAPNGVSPLAVANIEKDGITLFLDQSIQSKNLVYVQPLDSSCCLGMSPTSLEAALKVFGHEAIYIDVQADPKIDRENPPDLAKHLPAPPAKTEAAPAPAPAAPAPAPAPKAKSSSKGSSQPVASKENLLKKHMDLTDVHSRTESIIQKVQEAMKLKEEEGVTEKWIMSRLKLDIEMQLNAVRNAAYAAGHLAGKGEVVAFGEKRYA